ncbi:MAG: class B sortase [Clostridia bacterium]|nr:class B sortase [Clostridia bacterium]
MNLIAYLKHMKKQRSDEGNAAMEAELELDGSREDFAGGVFINSLDDLTEEDITLSSAAAAKKGVSVFEIARRIMFWICLTVFAASCLMLVQNLIDKQRSVEIYSQLQEEFFSSGFNFNDIDAFRPEEGEVSYLAGDSEEQTMVSLSDRIAGIEQEMAEAAADSPAKKNNNEVLERMRAGIASLAQINPDVYGWISVEGTTIDYPLVQGEDNDYYLNHAYTGEFLPNGSIFVDYRNYEEINRNFNTVMYGHNITSGAMFHDMEKFIKDSTYEEYFYNTTINIYTNDGIFIYEPFSVYKTRMDYNYFKTGFRTTDEFITFCEEVKANSKHQKDMTFTETDRIITMSTCTNINNAERYALHAKLIKAIVE